MAISTVRFLLRLNVVYDSCVARVKGEPDTAVYRLQISSRRVSIYRRGIYFCRLSRTAQVVREARVGGACTDVSFPFCLSPFLFFFVPHGCALLGS